GAIRAATWTGRELPRSLRRPRGHLPSGVEDEGVGRGGFAAPQPPPVIGGEAAQRIVERKAVVLAGRGERRPQLGRRDGGMTPPLYLASNPRPQLAPGHNSPRNR